MSKANEAQKHEKKHTKADKEAEERQHMIDDAKAVAKEEEAKAQGRIPQSGTSHENEAEFRDMSDKEKAEHEEKLRTQGSGLGAEVKVEGAPKDEVIEPKGSIKGMKIGAQILFYKRAHDNQGLGKLRALPGMIVDFPDAAGNFQAKDGAANIVFFSSNGSAAIEVRHSVLFCDEPTEGRWGFNK